MSLQQQLSGIGQVGKPTPVLMKGISFSVPGILLIPRAGYPLLTVRKPTGLKVYQVQGDDLLPRGTVTRPEAYKEFEDCLKDKAAIVKSGPNGAILTSAVNEKECHEFIVQFLRLNPEPSDKQIHELADALGVDSETLEAEIYKLLGIVVAKTSDEEVLDGEKDPHFGPTRQTMLNDEGFDEGYVDEIQKDTRDDGLLTP